MSEYIVRAHPFTKAVPSVAAAVEAYRAHIEANGFGASDIDHARVKRGTRIVAWISYNGRLWTAKPGTPAAKPLNLIDGHLYVSTAGTPEAVRVS